MTPGFREDEGEGSSGDSIVILSENQHSGESPLLPSPHTLKIMCHPETHPLLDTSLKLWI